MKKKIIFILISCLLFSFTAEGQKKEKMFIIRGEVKDSSANPVEGVSFLIDGMNTTSKTDRKGHYRINTNKDAKEIQVVIQEGVVCKTLIDGRKSINFEVPSTRGSDKLKSRKEITQSDTVLKNKRDAVSDDVPSGGRRFSSYSDIYEMIKGELSSVQIRGTSVYIQGIQTFGGDSEALFVVDGISTDRINDISPNDVKSIQLIKGPATASYGMRGANGVILITTLRGTDKK